MHRLTLRAIVLTCAFLVFALTVRAAAPGSTGLGVISAGPAMLEPRSGHTATLLADGKVLIAGGMRRNQDFYKSSELYDPATVMFQSRGEMSLGRVGLVAVLLE